MNSKINIRLGIVKGALLLLAANLLTGCFLFKPPRCPIPACHVRMIHAHGGTEFRGEPWWRLNKNRKVGQDYKPQKESYK